MCCCELSFVGIRGSESLKQFENCHFDTFKLYYHAHGAKTNNPLINVGGDESLVLHDYEKPLHDFGISKNE